MTRVFNKSYDGVRRTSVRVELRFTPAEWEKMKRLSTLEGYDSPVIMIQNHGEKVKGTLLNRYRKHTEAEEDE